VEKQHILDEIRRVAEAHGGAPPGKRALLTETGIRESDWSGKYWVRWSEALTEAGYTANRKQEPYKRDFLVGMLIDLTRELGHFPVSAELRMKARRDPNFPSDKTLARLGTRADQLRVVTEYCQAHEGFRDVLPLLSPLPKSFEEVSVEPDTTKGIGFVYLLKSGRNYKIGRSNSVGRREYELAIQLPERAMKVHEIRTDDPVGIEEYWHKRFASKRKNGEWFELSAADVTAFLRRKFM